MVVGSGLQGGLGGGQSLGSGCSIRLEQLFHYVGDWTFEEAGVAVDEVGKAVWIDSSVDLLDNCAFDEVTHLERLHGLGLEFLGYRDFLGG